MGKSTIYNLPEDLEKLFRQLRSSSCSLNWDWEKLYSILESGGRHGSMFWSICEAGVYHLLHAKTANKDSCIKCKEIHSPSVNVLQFAGACFSRLLFTGLSTKRCDKFRDILIKTVSELLDSIILSFEICDFSPEVLQSIKVCRDLRLPGLQRLLVVDKGTHGPKICMQVALCRIDLLSSALRSIFECGLKTELPVCVPYICNMISSSLSVDHCDPRHTSSDLIQCWKRLLNCFSTVFLSCGIHISPAAASIITGLVYQLEWSAHYAQSHPSAESLLHKLAVYRCISSITQASAQLSSTTLVRLMPRIITEISHDISAAAALCDTKSVLFSTASNVFELQMCSTVAAILLCEQLFVGHAYAMYDMLSNEASLNDEYAEDNPAYKLKITLFQVYGNLLQFVKRLIFLLSQNSQVSSYQNAILRPYLLIPTLNAIIAIESKNLFSYGSCIFKSFAHLLLRHEDPAVRACAERNLHPKYNQVIKNPFFLENAPTDALSNTTPATKSGQIDLISTPSATKPIPNSITVSTETNDEFTENQFSGSISTLLTESINSLNITHVKEVALPSKLDTAPTIVDTTYPSGKRAHPHEEESSSEKRPCQEEEEDDNSGTIVQPALPDSRVSSSHVTVFTTVPVQPSFPLTSPLDSVLCTFDDTLL